MLFETLQRISLNPEVLSLLATAGIGAVAFVGPANTVEPKTRVALRASMKPLPESQA